jgi:UV excision repair protein RAD23
VTPEEKAAIDRIAAFGFDKIDSLEAYLCCGKDENLAVNYLLENQGSGGLMSEHIRKEEEE